MSALGQKKAGIWMVRALTRLMEWQLENPEKGSESAVEWVKENREKLLSS